MYNLANKTVGRLVGGDGDGALSSICIVIYYITTKHRSHCAV